MRADEISASSGHSLSVCGRCVFRESLRRRAAQESRKDADVHGNVMAQCDVSVLLAKGIERPLYSEGLLNGMRVPVCQNRILEMAVTYISCQPSTSGRVDV